MTSRIAIALLLLVSLPFVLAHFASGESHVFGGFLLNPADGNSYLAKMYQGWRGEWTFTLPYSSEPGQGAYLFTFYLFLGHVARWFGAPLILVFHGARLIGVAFLSWATWQFINRLELEQSSKHFAYALACLGLGLGWLVFLFGVVTSDFWVAEAYPFLSGYINPHFCLSLGLLLWLLLPSVRSPAPGQPMPSFSWKRLPLVLLAAAFLASMSPFAVVLALAVEGIFIAWEWLEWCRKRKTVPTELENKSECASLFTLITDWMLIFLGGIPVMIYAVAAVGADPALAAWNSQNLTPSPPVWDLLLAFSPALILALPGAYYVFRSRIRSGRVLLVWLLLAGILIYFPFGLQRRFLLGLYIPIVGLAAFGLKSLEGRLKSHSIKISIVVTALALPSMFLVLLLGQFGALTRDPLLYLTRGEATALEWMAANTPERALVLASPRMGMFIPAHTGRRVIYGHPFETVNAEAEEAAVTGLFEGAAPNPMEAVEFIKDRGIDYIFWGPSEQDLGALDGVPNLDVAYNYANIVIYRVVDP